jgi:uracil-DNA glycosylase
MTSKTNTELLREIRDEVRNLVASPLYAYRTENNYHAVLGEGNHQASIMFVGEAPGKNEALTGRPFCGAAGKILDELLSSVDIKREDVYITNIVKDRPPDNRDPLPEEIELYAPFLLRQIEIIKPKVLIGLGRFSSIYIMEKFGLAEKVRTISKMHGMSFVTEAPFGLLTIVPFYHPAAAIYSTATKDELKKDFQLLKKFAVK